MKIYTSIEMQWDGTKYVIANPEHFEYTGIVEQCCGATGAQNQIQSSQIALMNTASQQATAIFGKDSSVFNDLVSTLSPTVQQGPNQQGYGPQELSNLNSQAITNNGIAAKNARQASGEQQSAAGGGNTVLPSGTSAAADANINTAIAANTANNLSSITEQGYQVGRQNYDTALSGLENAPNVFGGATSALSTASGVGANASQTASSIAAQNNSWVQGLTGALGGVLGSAVGGGGVLGKVLGGGGGSNPYQSLYNAQQPASFGTTAPPAPGIDPTALNPAPGF